MIRKDRFREVIAETESLQSPRELKDQEIHAILTEYSIWSAAHDQELLWTEIPPFNLVGIPVVAQTFPVSGIHPWTPMEVSPDFTEFSFVDTPADWTAITPVDQNGLPGIDTSDSTEE